MLISVMTCTFSWLQSFGFLSVAPPKTNSLYFLMKACSLNPIVLGGPMDKNPKECAFYGTGLH